MNYIASSFSLSMVPFASAVHILVEPCLPSDVPADCLSAIGHLATAQALSLALGREVPANRVPICLTPADTLYVSQFLHPTGRAPENQPITDPTKFPPISFMRVRVLP